MLLLSLGRDPGTLSWCLSKSLALFRALTCSVPVLAQRPPSQRPPFQLTAQLTLSGSLGLSLFRISAHTASALRLGHS